MSPLNGVVQKHNDDGNLIFECSFKNGLKDGPLKVWCSNGNLVFSSGYKLGLPNGAFQWWYSNGKPKAKCTYSNGLLNGKCEEWYLDYNQLKYEENYQNGELTGVQRYFNQTGEYLGGGNLIEGNGKLVFYHNQNQKSIEANYLNGVLEGQVACYNQVGELIELKNFTSGKLNGLHQTWKDGKLASERNYIDGEEDGISKRWINDYGIFLIEEQWENSKLLNSKYWNENLELIDDPHYFNWDAIEIEKHTSSGYYFLNLDQDQLPGKWCDAIKIKKQILYLIFDNYGGFIYCTFE
jgi:antitoxin component YwqK of YwqJK toxin-antitoxin module